MKKFITVIELIDLYDETDFDTNLVLSETEPDRVFKIIDDSKIEDVQTGAIYTYQGIIK